MKFIPKYFLLSMLITVLILYLFYPDPRIIIKYPNPHDKISLTYIDDTGKKYKYHRIDLMESVK